MAAQKWDLAAVVARHMTKVQPEDPQWWIDYGIATRRSESVEKAEAILMEALEIHPNEAMIHYNLACYASITGRIDLAKERWREALKLDKDLRLLGFEDPDLQPIWDSFAEKA